MVIDVFWKLSLKLQIFFLLPATGAWSKLLHALQPHHESAFVLIVVEAYKHTGQQVEERAKQQFTCKNRFLPPARSSAPAASSAGPTAAQQTHSHQQPCRRLLTMWNPVRQL